MISGLEEFYVIIAATSREYELSVNGPLPER
jgi:hypothetical protein